MYVFSATLATEFYPVPARFSTDVGPCYADRECGLSAAQGDSEAFAEAIGRLAGDDDLRAAYSRRARGLAETVLNRGNVVIPLLDALETVNSPDTP
jgi:uncharacterized protein YbjT (DUF2867 family)